MPIVNYVPCREKLLFKRENDDPDDDDTDPQIPVPGNALVEEPETQKNGKNIPYAVHWINEVKLVLRQDVNPQGSGNNIKRSANQKVPGADVLPYKLK